MNEHERITRQKELIETIGRNLEKQGIQPVAGRILGMLMVMDKEEYTFDEIVEEMKISKSSASNALRNLELREAIEYVTYPGDRKRYFRISFSDVNKLIEGVKKKFQTDADIFDEVISLKKDSNSKNACALKAISKGMRYFITILENFQNKI
ncbi:MAG: MarR family transcriptional regulator [Bacteroidales bacterium]|nr:MarR family transcriptional regulator [Bacteroidales bacterium]